MWVYKLRIFMKQTLQTRPSRETNLKKIIFKIWKLEFCCYNSRNGEQGRIFTLKESMWFALTSLTPQGGGEGPKAISGKVTFSYCQLGYEVFK